MCDHEGFYKLELIYTADSANSPFPFTEGYKVDEKELAEQTQLDELLANKFAEVSDTPLHVIEEYFHDEFENWGNSEDLAEVNMQAQIEVEELNNQQEVNW